MTINVAIDTLSMVNRQVKIANLYEILVESTVRNLRLLENTILDSLDEVTQPEVFHFYPEEIGHFFTKIYLKGHNEEELRNNSKKTHKTVFKQLF